MSDQNQMTEFSGEEMLEAARAKTSDGGVSESREVIVQDDGSKVVRVKRRRRKNNSMDLLAANEEEQKFHLKLLLWSLISLVVLSALVAGVIFFRVVSLNNPGEITALQQDARTQLGADVSMKGYRVGAKKAIIDSLSINSSDQDPYSFLIRKIEVPLNPELILLGKFDGDAASAAYSLFKFDSKFLNGESFSQVDLGLPFSQESISVSDANVVWGNNGKEKNRFTIKNAEGKFSVRKDESLQAVLRKGVVANSGALPPRLENAIFVFDKDTVNVQALTFGDGEVGTLSISGEYSKGQDGAQELDCSIEKMKLENLNLHLRSLLEARITSNQGKCIVNSGQSEFSIEADFQASESGFVMRNFQFLHDIAGQIGSLPEASVSFAKLSRGTIEMTNDGYKFKNLHFESISNLALIGEFSIDLDGNVSGELSVGLSVAKIKQVYPEVSNPDFEIARGFVWVPTTLSGTVSLPKDDFMMNFKKGVLKR